jgi:Kef-type K+ transport system membrane component KefB
MSNLDLVARLFLQLATILLVCQLIAYLGMRFLGQTRVVCEMIAGILLGPSFFGLIAPHLSVLVINILYWQCHQKESETRMDVG